MRAMRTIAPGGKAGGKDNQRESRAVTHRFASAFPGHRCHVVAGFAVALAHCADGRGCDGGESGPAAGPRASGDGGRGHPERLGLGARDRPEPHLPAGRPVDDVCRADPVHRSDDRHLRALLPEPQGLGGQVLQRDDAVHGRHAGRGAVRQPVAAGGVLGTHQPVFVPAGGLLEPPGRRARRSPPSAGRDRRRRAGHAGRLCAAGPDRRHL